MNPPKWISEFLRWICPEHLYEEIEGDLIQKFERDLKQFGQFRARRRFIWNALRFCRPGIVFRNKFSFNLNQIDMLLNHLKFAIRVFLKDKYFSALNILGLALGIAVSIVLLLVLKNDLTYDQHYENHERIYRLGADMSLSGSDSRTAVSAREMSYVLKDYYPEIERITRVGKLNRALVKPEIQSNQVGFYEDQAFQADSTYFQVFSHSFISGDMRTCMSDPNSVVITESTAKKYFDDADPLNKLLMVENVPKKVSAVIKDLPENTHLKFDILLSGLVNARDWTMKDGKPISETFWNPDVYVYMVLPENYDVKNFQSRFLPIYATYMKEIGDQIEGKYVPLLRPLAALHFDSDFEDDEPHGSKTFLYSLTGIGMLIVLLAVINYMNLSTAKAGNRAIEIAMKKIVGSGKRILVLSLLTESVMLSLIALILAFLFVFLLLDVSSFNQLVGRNLRFDPITDPMLLLSSASLVLIIGILSGLYSAFYLPSIPAISALKGSFKTSASSHTFRRVLITAQFVISIFVVTCTVFMKEQLNFVRNKDLGFNKDNLLVVAINDTLVKKKIPSITAELMRNPEVLAATTSHSIMGLEIGTGVMLVESETGMRKQGGLMVMGVGDNYISTMGMTLLKGRDFLPGPTTELEGGYIANETAIKLMGWENDPLGKKLSFFHGQAPGKVIGVVKDFHSTSLHRPALPVFLNKTDWFNGYLQLRLSGDDLPGTISFIQKQWESFDPNHPFEYFFFDQSFNQQYKEDESQNRLLSILSYICIFISLLGLIGLSAFNVSKRSKEMGVRKVLGASISNLILLLSKEAISLVVVSSLLVAPFAYWVVNRWLANFAYQIQINYLLYGALIVGALVLVFMTVLFQSLKIARSNPVDSLKYE